MLRALAPLALIAIAIAGCGGDNDGDQEGRTATVPAGGPIEVVGNDYSFDPQTLVVSGGAGKEIEIILRNEGALAHNLKLFKDGDEVGGTPTFQGGKTESGKVELEAGSYEMICTVGNHEQLGMKGTLRIE